MSDRPIIFSAPMVRALQAGRKSQTRRVIKPQPREWEAQVIDIGKPHFDEEQGGWGQWETEWSAPSWEMPMGEPARDFWRPLRIPYAPGDRLYVREAVCWVSAWGWRYRADSDDLSEKREAGEVSRWRPSIHMPRWASRITLTVTDVRVQRLQEISEADAMAEGVVPTWPDGEPIQHDRTGGVCREAFQAIWNSLHGPDAWDANPWVVAVSFTVDRRNIDAGAE